MFKISSNRKASIFPWGVKKCLLLLHIQPIWLAFCEVLTHNFSHWVSNENTFYWSSSVRKKVFAQIKHLCLHILIHLILHPNLITTCSQTLITPLIYLSIFTQAKTFRQFWGSKSELRRFQDGSINEAVLWSCSNASQKKLVCKQITEHLLKL